MNDTTRTGLIIVVLVLIIMAVPQFSHYQDYKEEGFSDIGTGGWIAIGGAGAAVVCGIYFMVKG